MVGFDNNGSDSGLKSSPNEESCDSSDDFSANTSSTRKRTAQNAVFHVHMALEEVFEQGHVIGRKISIKQIQN